MGAKIWNFSDFQRDYQRSVERSNGILKTCVLACEYEKDFDEPFEVKI